MKYTPEFKVAVVKDLRDNAMSFKEASRKYLIQDTVIAKWERIFLEEGESGLFKERRGRTAKSDNPNNGRPPKLDKKVEDDLISENQRLRVENEYLKKLDALVQERIKRENLKKLK